MEDDSQKHKDSPPSIEKEIETVEKKIDEFLSPYEKEIDRLDTVPGINQNIAASILAEIGLDRSVFPSERPLAS